MAGGRWRKQRAPGLEAKGREGVRDTHHEVAGHGADPEQGEEEGKEKVEVQEPAAERRQEKRECV